MPVCSKNIARSTAYPYLYRFADQLRNVVVKSIECSQVTFAGDVGLGINPYLRDRVAEVDLLLLLGCRFSENPSQGFSLLDIPGTSEGLVHVHPGPEELGRIYSPKVAINATPGEFLKNALGLKAGKGWPDLCAADHAAYLGWTDKLPAGVGNMTMSHAVSVLRDRLPAESIMTNGAGNYAIWINRFYKFGWGRQLAPTSGSMGYGLPAAIAAAKRFPDRPIVAMAGDGCFQMSGMEFGVACEHNLNVKVLVCDNGIYGTIRMHQERDYPGRQSGTSMRNPDFAAWARSYGAVGISVEANESFEAALDEALAFNGPCLLHLRLDPRDIAPGKTL